MGDSTYHKHPIQLSDSTINQRPKRRKYESEQRETLAQLLYQLEKKSQSRCKAAILIRDNYDLGDQFRDLKTEGYFSDLQHQ